MTTTFDLIDFEVQQIRQVAPSMRLVILVVPMYRRDIDIPEYVETMPWVVKDVLSGEIYTVEENRFGDTVYNEMEALAWAAQDHPDFDLAGD